MWLALCWRSVQILLYGYTAVDFLPKFFLRIKQNAKKTLENLQRTQLSNENANILGGSGENIAGNHEEYSKVFQAAETKGVEINTAHVPVCKGKLNSLSASQMPSRQQQGESISLPWDKEAREYHQGCKEPSKISNNNYCRRRTVVTEIAKRFEENDFNVKVHKASLSQTVSDVYFERASVSKETTDQNLSPKSNAFSSNFPRSASSNKHGGVHDELIEKKDNTVSTNYKSTSTCNASQANNNLHSNQFDHCLNHNGLENPKIVKRDKLLLEEDVFRNNCTEKQVKRRGLHSPVESIEDILAQQRFSRSFSTYSISDLLKDCPIDVDVDEYINNINK